MHFEWIGTILTKYHNQHFGEDSDSKSHSFLQHLPQVCQKGIPLMGALCTSALNSLR